MSSVRKCTRKTQAQALFCVSGVCDPGRGDGGVPSVLAALLLLVPDCHHLWRGLLMPRCPGRHPLLDRSESLIIAAQLKSYSYLLIRKLHCSTEQYNIDGLYVKVNMDKSESKI